MRYLIPLLACFTLPLGMARAQWQIGVDAGAFDFGAIARDTVSDARWVTLGSGVTAGVRLERGMGSVRIAFSVSTAGMSLVVEDDTVFVGVKRTFRVVELPPEVAFRLTTTSTGAAVWLEAGPLLGVWLPDGGEGRVRGGAFGGLGVAVPLLARVTGAFGVRATFSASPFEEGEVVSDFARSTAPRVTAQAGVRYRL